ncbi:MAG: FecR family protein [Desulfatiglandales bacterium]
MRRHPVSFLVITLVLCLVCLMAVCSPVTARQSSAAVSPDALPEDMRDLQIQENYIPASFKTVGTIHSLQGNVVVVHRADRQAYLGSEGDTIHENDEFYTLPGSRCRLRFVNEDVVSLAPETLFSVDSYTSQEDKGEKTSLFSMAKGKAMFYAMRLFKFKQARFRVKTPTAVMGVRGTKFGAHVYWMDEKTADSRGVQVAGSGRSIGPYLAQAGGGNGTSVTVAAVYDGYVDVNGVTLGPGQYYNSYTGTVGYDSKVLGGIEGDTSGDKGDEGEGEGEGYEGEGHGDIGDLVDTATDVTSTQTGADTEEAFSVPEGDEHEFTESYILDQMQ